MRPNSPLVTHKHNAHSKIPGGHAQRLINYIYVRHRVFMEAAEDSIPGSLTAATTLHGTVWKFKNSIPL